MNGLTKWSRNGFLPLTLGRVDDLLQNVFGEFAGGLLPEIMLDPGCTPQLELEVADKEVIAKIPLPGFTAETINVEVQGRTLTVRAERSETNDADGDNRRYLRRERSRCSYEESTDIPVAVIGRDTKASYHDGVLTVVMPREKESAPKSCIVKVD